jgi:tRNA:m4X modification enzyme
MSEDVACSALPPVFCSFFLTKKRRNCKMRVKTGALYCAEHLTSADAEDDTKVVVEDARIPCPLDPAHSVYESRLKAHLKKCNARIPEIIPSYFYRDLNLCPADSRLQSSNQNKPTFTELVSRINRVYTEVLQERHEISQRLLGDASHSVKDSDKHRLQQEALTELILKNVSVTNQEKVVVIEFGAGKGGLSNYIWEEYFMKHPERSVDFILIDRSNSRCKRDAKMKHEGANVRRIFIDIKDLDLNDLLSGYEASKTHFLWISKHLCGAATCLTLNSLQGQLDLAVKGTLCVALCCHQACSWSSYPNKQFLYEKGLILSEEDGEGVFKMLCSITSWAVCCFRAANEENAEAKRLKFDASDEVEFSDEQKEATGRMMKRLLDHGRELKLRQKRDGNKFSCKLMHYIEENVTLENAVLWAHSGETEEYSLESIHP